MLDYSLLNKDEYYAVAVSGGPDSMAMLDKLFQDGYHFHVCHVNYHKRPTSDRDQTIVTSYCEEHQIPYSIHHAPKEYQGNFQQWAREERYTFFEEIYRQVGANALLVAHQQDDALETYLFRKHRNRFASVVGIAPRVQLGAMEVRRPLWHVSRQTLRDYCMSHQVHFGDDETNVMPLYSRNRIRRMILEMPSEEKQQLIASMYQEAESWNRQQEGIQELLKNTCQDGKIYLPDYLKLNEDQQTRVLLHYLLERNPLFYQRMSATYLLDLRKQISSRKVSLEIYLPEVGVLCKEYDFLFLDAVQKHPSFEYVVVSPNQDFTSAEVQLRLSGQPNEGVNLSPDDYPLVVRSYRPGDSVQTTYGHKKVSRLFIDQKIPRSERNTIPLLINRDGQIVFIPGIYKEDKRKRLQSNVFVIK